MGRRRSLRSLTQRCVALGTSAFHHRSASAPSESVPTSARRRSTKSARPKDRARRRRGCDRSTTRHASGVRLGTRVTGVGELRADDHVRANVEHPRRRFDSLSLLPCGGGLRFEFIAMVEAPGIEAGGSASRTGANGCETSRG
jgi:hypothetical protein